MKSEKHMLIGGIAGASIYCVYKKFNGEGITPYGVIGSLTLGGLSGVLADILEPANNPHHRSLFHSLVFMAIVVLSNQKILENPSIDESTKMLALTPSSGYLSHLLVDATTKKGIPLIE
ncbi:MAG: metal-dependent hydrolase [Candidatus Methanofastidiosia archaeon]